MRSRVLSLPLRFVTWLLAWWIRPDVLPADAASLLDADQPVLYVLESGGLADRAALNIVCRRLGLPAPTRHCEFHSVRENSSVVVLRKPAPGLLRRTVARLPSRLARLINEASLRQSAQLQIAPVAIYWGRSPEREASLLKQMFSENWRVAGRTAKFFKTIVHGRYTLVQFSQPLSLVPILAGGDSQSVAVRKVFRILRVHFRNRRIATLGPDLSHRRTLLDRVLLNRAVLAEQQRQSGGDQQQLQKLQLTAKRYAHEIAADISYSSVRVLRTLLSRLWNRLYDGIRLDGLQPVQAVADGRELVYVPCHRSHIDYLLLSYALHMHGMSLPHIAAGINLNIPLVGPLLRRGGAFFLRRSFKGNRLYALVFNAYLQEILQRGHSLEYFIEGGRSRTGRLLPPKGGMLAMTAHSYLQQPDRALMFVPVYFGYERLVEGGAFASELTGGKKEKESLGGLIRSLRLLRQTFGSVYVNFGVPLDFPALLDQHNPQWRQQAVSDDRPQWLSPVVEQLGHEIMRRINCAASVTPVSLLSFAMLTNSHGRIAMGDLQRFLHLLQQLQATLPYSEQLVMTDSRPRQIVEHGVQLKYIRRVEYELGDIVEIRDNQAIPMSFFRNNVLHLYALQACVACCFVNRSKVSVQEIQRLLALVYPFLRNELFLYWPADALAARVDSVIEQYVELGLLRLDGDKQHLQRMPAGSESSFLLRSLGQSIMPSLQRYYLGACLLSRFGSGVISAADLGRVCGKCAERMEQIHGLRSPDFYDKALFNGFIETLHEQRYISFNEAELIEISDQFSFADADARTVLGEQTRHSILNIVAKAAVARSVSA